MNRLGAEPRVHEPASSVSVVFFLSIEERRIVVVVQRPGAMWRSSRRTT
jgi:hypothetical protein